MGRGHLGSSNYLLLGKCWKVLKNVAPLQIKKWTCREADSAELGEAVVHASNREGGLPPWSQWVFKGEQFHFPIFMVSGEGFLPNWPILRVLVHQGPLLYMLLVLRKTLKLTPAKKHGKASEKLWWEEQPQAENTGQNKRLAEISEG